MSNSSSVTEKIKVLMIGGMENNALEITAYLKTHSDEIDYLEWAKTGQDGISKTKTLNPDIVLVDSHMPDMNMNSLHVVRFIREASESIKIITMSMSNNPQWIMNSIDAGADDYISQPMLGVSTDKYILMDNMYNVVKRLYYHIGTTMREEMNMKKELL